MTTRGSLQQPTDCPRCKEGLIAPTWSGPVSAMETRHLWRCSKCGYMFESLDLVDAEQTLPAELAEEFLPNLLVA